MTEEIKEFKCNLDKQFERYFKEVDGEFKGVIPFMIIYLYQLMIQTETPSGVCKDLITLH